ncbi:hypothetical protein L873DRAFT_1842539 [Choiromyces venosus 120613-1]|uniref:Peptide hydrolase n=1 Tax=Choiromyces venosus 120613-1 TaxID=1336337 RepID=A0A3N4K5H1_9PEZI|nr:hypothetical protein L873DRAFT_1842539 [Choiromyces venosus 120613-1]
MKELSNFSVNNAIRFGWWSVAEFGLLGSNYYVENLSEEEKGKIRLYINLDMISSPNYVHGVTDGDGSEFLEAGAPGSGAIEEIFQDTSQLSMSPWKLRLLRITLPLLKPGLPLVIFTQDPARSRPQSKFLCSAEPLASN